MASKEIVEVDSKGNVRSEAEVAQDRVIDALYALGSKQQQDDSIEFVGTKIVLPETYAGRVPDAIKYLQKYEKDQTETYEFSRTFNYRPWDGAAAFQRAMKGLFGTAGIGQKTYGMFGMEFPPEYHTINVGPRETLSVPWGRVSLDVVKATFTLGSVNNKEYGSLFKLYVEAPKKYRSHIDGFFQIVEKELRDHSIYRGKAINGASDPAFLDVANLDPTKVVYADETLRQLGANVWSLLDYSDVMRAENIKLKRSVLLEGPYGTGKSLGGLLTAQRAERNGWTFILVRPGQDDLADSLKTAQLYAPAVVWFEDVDTVSVGATATDMSKILDMLDSVTTKGVEVLAGFTTNHVDRLPKGVLRPGRIDAIIHIGGLDETGYRKLTESIIRAELLGDIDYGAVAKAFDYRELADGENVTIDGIEVVKDGKVVQSGYGYVLREDGKVVHEGFLPAFAAEAIERAQRYVIEETGKPGVIETRHLVDSAKGLYRQRELMAAAEEGVLRVPSLDAAFGNVVRSQIVPGLDGKVQLGDNDDLTLVRADKK